jgi:hypothetical protein
LPVVLSVLFTAFQYGRGVDGRVIHTRLMGVELKSIHRTGTDPCKRNILKYRIIEHNLRYPE